ncbi:hypothetical protein HMPREF1982_02152 [Clostridiales bacterium oral taxon 876 str. F0540]|nr:hypothetical protein HMPREF1982_02152 [Clostridiales bacterium oral taxon 876 str. F0540]
MWKKIQPIIISLAVLAILFFIFSPQKISKAANINYEDVTKIQFVDGSLKNKPLVVVDKQKVQEFMQYIGDCVLVRWFNNGKVGWTRMAAFYEGDKRVLNITLDNVIEINGKYYRVIGRGMSIKKIDRFLQSVDPLWETWK